MTRIGLIIAWVAATALTTILAWQVVGAADEQVSDQPTTPLIALTTPEAADSTSTMDDTSSSLATNPSSSAGTASSSTGAPNSGSSTPSSASTATTASNSTSTSSDSNSSTSTTNGSTSTTTQSSSTTVSGIPATTTAVSDGGTVTVTGTIPSVEIVAVVAAPGWAYRVTENRGDRVEVEFTDTSGAEIRIRCEWKNGQLVADIDD
jgi:hypothetical protein